ncbi:MAG: CRISPR-associated RAMP protein, Csm4 family [uncultured Thiotrichaceae bacterium]|uniref:CRISPR system Cms protein Csm4 n=1 Tax=uncultured Thiotrichaceae bacterium TaxID=298394 RepID=A0A6S6TQH0_9GAMM|nr:MAG: CRISPR-associated RAMP protein, Csm4 family [uncultured Thiotrichaceae bacterium]
MQTYRLRISPQSAFGTALLGDTFFGQLCWAIRHRFGENKLAELLETYTYDAPFLVVSNAFPTGHIPLPSLPGQLYFDAVSASQRKAVKKQVWLPIEMISQPLNQWQTACETDKQLIDKKNALQPHNSINRYTGTTGESAFAPYTMQQTWYSQAISLDIYLILDEQRISGEDIQTCIEDMGVFGYGRDASIGLGKFDVLEMSGIEMPEQKHANAYLTLAPCAPQGQGFNTSRSYYELFTRFGRHGDMAVQGAQPFKNPVLMAKAGAVFTPSEATSRQYIGKGLGSNGELSKTIPETVQQGYAPVINFHLPTSVE